METVAQFVSINDSQIQLRKKPTNILMHFSMPVFFLLTIIKLNDSLPFAQTLPVSFKRRNTERSQTKNPTKN